MLPKCVRVENIICKDSFLTKHFWAFMWPSAAFWKTLKKQKQIKVEHNYTCMYSPNDYAYNTDWISNANGSWLWSRRLSISNIFPLIKE